MRAGKQETEPFVGDVGLFLGGRREQLHVGGEAIARLPPPDRVNGFAPRNGQQPALGVRGAAVLRPVGQRRRERLGQGVLGGCNVTRARGQKRDELTVTPSRHRFDRVVHITRHVNSYQCTTLPFSNARVFVSCNGSRSVIVSNNVRPLPMTIGFTTIWYSSISRASVSCETMLPLPRMTMSAPGWRFSFVTSLTRSPFTSVVFCQVTASSVREKTIFFIAFIPVATAGSMAAACGVGQKAAICSYVTRPNKSSARPLALLLANAFHSSSRL